MFNHLATILLLAVVSFSCQNTPSQKADPTTVVENTEQQTPEEPIMTEVIFSDSIVLPAGWVLIGEARGDLNKNGQDERVLIVEATVATEDEAPERRIRTYQKGTESWTFWQEMTGAVLAADLGGMLGDPFQEVSIERSCIVLKHFGGSRIRWSYTHRYSWQNNAWEMIGATILYGAPCDYWHEFDYNLSTGKVVGEIETENCEEETSTTDRFEFSHQIRPLPTMDKHEPGSTAVAVPGRDLTFYF